MTVSEPHFEQFHGTAPAEEKSALKHAEDVAGAFFRSLAYSAFQQPVDGVTQLVDGVTHAVVGRDLVPRVSFISAPKAAEFGSAEWAARLAGGGIGTILPFYVGGKLGLEAVKGTARGPLLEGMVSRLGILEDNSTAQLAFKGAVYEGIFHPADESQGNLFGQRAINTAAGALSFGTLGFLSKGMRGTDFGGRLMESKIAGVPLLSGTGIDALSGVGSGFVDLTVKDTLNGKVPTWKEYADAAGEYAVLGASLHLVKTPMEAAKSKWASMSTESVKGSDGQNTETGDRSTDGQPAAEEQAQQSRPTRSWTKKPEGTGGSGSSNEHTDGTDQSGRPVDGQAAKQEEIDPRDYTSMGRAGKVIGFDKKTGDEFVYQEKPNTLSSDWFNMSKAEFEAARMRTFTVNGRQFAVDTQGKAYELENIGDAFTMRETNELIVKHIDDAQVPWPPVPLDDRAPGHHPYKFADLIAALRGHKQQDGTGSGSNDPIMNASAADERTGPNINPKPGNH